ncbi:hypothetical protein C2S52_008584 [Perilla frutescens var. hirtella]|nr:hypothetical protein C2S52_008584 [Perilla frutescens var. hirtella]
MQRHSLRHSQSLMQHKRCGNILGEDRFKICTSIELDFDKITVTVRWMRKKIKLLANKSEAEYPDIPQTGFNSVLHKWTEKLLGFVYEMHYKKWIEIRPVDTLSGIEEGKKECEAISLVNPIWVQELASYKGDPHFDKIITSKEEDSTTYLKFNWTESLPRYNEGVTVGNNTELRDMILDIVRREVKNTVQKIKVMILHLRRNLNGAHIRMKVNTDKSRIKKVLDVENHIYLKLQPNCKNFISLRLELFESSRVHPMFHILLLKKKVRVDSELSDDPKGEVFCITPYAFLKIRAIERDKETITHVLVPWEEGGNSSLVDSTSVYTDGLVKGEKLVPWQVVEAPKTNGIVLFSNETFGEKEVSHFNHLKRKAEQELHLTLSVELKIRSSIIVITNLTDVSFSLVKSHGVLCLET